MKLISDCFYFLCKILGLLSVWERQRIIKYFWGPLSTLFLLVSGHSVVSHFSSELNQFIMCLNKHLKPGNQQGRSMLSCFVGKGLSLISPLKSGGEWS